MDMMGKSLLLGVPLGDFGIRYQLLFLLRTADVSLNWELWFLHQERNAAPSQGQTERTSRTTNLSCTCTHASTCGTNTTRRRPRDALLGTLAGEGQYT